jgi:hypothetical protein
VDRPCGLLLLLGGVPFLAAVHAAAVRLMQCHARAGSTAWHERANGGEHIEGEKELSYETLKALTGGSAVPASSEGAAAHEFFVCLALCHTVVPVSQRFLLIPL